MPNKMPTDAKIVKSLMAFEMSWNVLLAAAKNGGDEDADKLVSELYYGLGAARDIAIRAQYRIDGRNISEEES